MKKLVSFLVICIMLFPMAGIAHADADTHVHEDGCCSEGSSIVATDENGNVLLTVVGEDNDIENMLNKARLALGSDGETTTRRGIVCCIPNPPTREIHYYSHGLVDILYCRAYRFVDWRCNLCGAFVRTTGPTDMGTHVRGTMYSCPN